MRASYSITTMAAFGGESSHSPVAQQANANGVLAPQRTPTKLPPLISRPPYNAVRITSAKLRGSP